MLRGRRVTWLSPPHGRDASTYYMCMLRGRGGCYKHTLAPTLAPTLTLTLPLPLSRGGCYKHTFYGIVSYQCMEATPSLACANKCAIPNP